VEGPRVYLYDRLHERLLQIEQHGTISNSYTSDEPYAQPAGARAPPGWRKIIRAKFTGESCKCTRRQNKSPIF